MANPEHLNILKQGVEVWNRWRKKNPDVVPDLSEAVLQRANLSYVNLSKAILTRANFSDAVLFYANLFKTVLHGANFSKTLLVNADFSYADLYGASLYGAYLFNTRFHSSHIPEACFKKARCLSTIFANVDLSETKNLDSVVHQGPSSISIDTLYESKGNIPEVFLRGCGVPDQMIEYARSLTAKPIDYYSCFISYSSMDEEFAKRLYNDLQVNNVRSWLACEDMKIGDKIRPTIEESIRLHDKLLLILSEESVKSKWVKYEVEKALDLEIERDKTVLFPVRVDDCVMDSDEGWANEIKQTRQIGDFTNWKNHDAYSAAFERLLRALKAG